MNGKFLCLSCSSNHYAQLLSFPFPSQALTEPQKLQNERVRS